MKDNIKVWLFGRSKIEKRLKRLERNMSQFTDVVAGLKAASDAMLARVSAHEASANAAIASLNATISNLQNNTSPEVVQAIADIKTVTANLSSFDPDVAPPAPVVPATPPVANP